MLLFYFGNWSVERGLISGEFARTLVFLAVAGRILGIGAYVERYEVEGRPLIEKYPALEYVLG